MIRHVRAFFHLQRLRVRAGFPAARRAFRVDCGLVAHLIHFHSLHLAALEFLESVVRRAFEPIVNHNRVFAVVGNGFARRLDDERADQPALDLQADVRVIKIRSGRLGAKIINKRRAWLNSLLRYARNAVHIVRAALRLPVPVNRRLLRQIVFQIDANALAFFDANLRSGQFAVVSPSLNDAIRRDFDFRFPRFEKNFLCRARWRLNRVIAPVNADVSIVLVKLIRRRAATEKSRRQQTRAADNYGAARQINFVI